MNKTHYSEADLLETYYMQPGASMPVMMHLADCQECAARYDRLERKLRQAAACSSHDKPETFWARQRLQILRRVEERKTRYASAMRTTRVAAAAALAFFLGGAIVYKSVEPALQPEVVVVATAAAQNPPVVPPPAALDLTGAHDAWQSDELKDFHSVVEWESWGDATKTGDQL
jgi:anti-sigma factor RsiW